MPVFSKIASFSQFRSLLKSPIVTNVVKTGKRKCHPPRAPQFSDNSPEFTGEKSNKNSFANFSCDWITISISVKTNEISSFLAARGMSDHGPRTIPMEPSRFQWHKFKDLFHYYVFVGLLPCAAVIFYTNVYIGPATLSEIPEGYVPKHWEYHRVWQSSSNPIDLQLID